MTTTTSIEVARLNCLRFARDHALTFVERGEVGFGRPCVGFTHDGSYSDFNPYNHADYEPIFPHDDRLGAPAGVNAYHKHDCFAVLAHGEDGEAYDAAVMELDAWVRHLEAQGELEVVEFKTGATGLQAMFTGTTGRALRFK